MILKDTIPSYKIGIFITFQLIHSGCRLLKLTPNGRIHRLINKLAIENIFFVLKHSWAKKIIKMRHHIILCLLFFSLRASIWDPLADNKY